MPKTANINIRIDPDVKKDAEYVFSTFGITLSDAINIFLRKSIMYGGLPFEIRDTSATQEFPKKRKLNTAKQGKPCDAKL